MNSALFFFFAVIPAVFAFNVNRENSKLFKQAVDKTGPDHPLLNLVQVQPKPSSSNSRSISHTRTERLQGPPNYWFHPKIHTFGNTGVFGALHAAIAPLATKLIDAAAYSGENVRVQAARNLRKRVAKSGANVLDLCCGVGISTRALRTAFHDANALLGIDTSPEMISMAQLLSQENIVSHILNNGEQALQGGCDASYIVGNAETTYLPPKSFDLVTIMYGFHEIPFLARYRILREARRILAQGGTLAIIDISPDYQPSPTMLAGEPYVLEYKKNIQAQLKSMQGFDNLSYEEVVPGHVGIWLLNRKPQKVDAHQMEAVPWFNVSMAAF